MARIAKKLWDNGFKLYLAFCLFTFTLLIFIINVSRVFGAEVQAQPVKGPVEMETSQTNQAPNLLPRNFYHWTLATDGKTQESIEFRGNKMFFKVNF